MSLLNRRTLIAGAALPLFAINTRPARAAEFSLKLANNSPATHPQSIRQQEAADRIKARVVSLPRSAIITGSPAAFAAAHSVGVMPSDVPAETCG